MDEKLMNEEGKDKEEPLMWVRDSAKMVREKVGLKTYPVGVKLIFADKPLSLTNVETLHGYRYCQAVMRARHGDHVLLNKEGISCPAAAAAFGFRPLPEGLKNGKGLIGFGITKEESTGREMFRGMVTLKPGELESLYLFPLETATVEPDVVVVEDQVEKLMWFALAYLNTKGGKRVESSTAILQATCVDATLIPYKKNKMNLSFGCYGCRDATDIGPDETVLGFPFCDFEKVAEFIEYLSKKAIPNSRSKNAFTILKKKRAEEILKTDIFENSSGD